MSPEDREDLYPQLHRLVLRATELLQRGHADPESVERTMESFRHRLIGILEDTMEAESPVLLLPCAQCGSITEQTLELVGTTCTRCGYYRASISTVRATPVAQREPRCAHCEGPVEEDAPVTFVVTATKSLREIYAIASAGHADTVDVFHSGCWLLGHGGGELSVPGVRIEP